MHHPFLHLHPRALSVAGGLLLGAASLAPPAAAVGPSPGSWSNLAPMAQARKYHQAVLLSDGHVLVAGGLRGIDEKPDDKTRFFNLETAELFDPRRNTWSPTGSINEPRFQAGVDAAFLLTGKVLLIGFDAEIYDPSTGGWSPTGPMPFQAADGNLHLLPSGLALSVSPHGGALYDPAANAWRATGPMTVSRFGFASAVLPSGQVLVAGGRDLATKRFSGPQLASAELFDPTSASWHATSPMGQVRERPLAAVLPNGKVLVAGGFTWVLDPNSVLNRLFGTSIVMQQATRTAELYDPTTGRWTPTGSMAYEHFGGVIAVLHTGQVLVAGGSNNDGTANRAELYDPASGTWSPAPDLAIWRPAGATATVLPTGEVLVTGGGVVNGANTPSVELYRP